MALIAIAALLLGVVFIVIFSSPVSMRDILAQGHVTVPSNGCQAVKYLQLASGDYWGQVNTDKGAVECIFNTDNTTTISWNNGSTVDLRDLPHRIIFNGSSGEFVNPVYHVTPLNQDSPAAYGYLILSNPHSYDENVSYTIWLTITYQNNFGLVGGIALLSSGAIGILLIIFRKRLKDFNKALEP